MKRLSPLDALVARSRLIGGEASLGLFGGGNTSIKCSEPDLFGKPQAVLWVKGSGADLRGCQRHHFVPLALAPLRPLAQRRTMTDEEMVRLLERCMLDPKAPRPSIETLLHAFIPEVAVDHTHADAILSIANTHRGASLIRSLFGEELLWIPYLQPGFALSRRVATEYQRHPDAHGAVLEHHGLLTWGPDGRTSYLRTITAVSQAEQFVRQQHRRRRWSVPAHTTLPLHHQLEVLRRWAPAIRHTISDRRRMCLQITSTPPILEFVNARRMPQLAPRGPATPDHMLRTKRLPFVVRLGSRSATNVSADSVIQQLRQYAAEHERYFRTYHTPKQTLQDPYPRVILIPGVGMLTSGKDATDAGMVAQLYEHAIAIMRNAAAVDDYTSVSAREAFNVEYWPLELYKRSLEPPEAELARQIGVVTGAAGGIGRSIAQRLVERGASVVVTDVNRRAVEQWAEELNQRAGRRRALGIAMDVTREESIRRAYDEVLRVFGGLDFLVSNAGIAHVAAVDRLQLVDWERSLSVNATGHFLVARATIRWLRAQGLGGSLVFIASKNVLAPGKEFGAYSAAKAAATQLARVLAIENGEFGIRVNIVNPDGVFEGSGLWKSIRASRARTYRIAPDRLETYYQHRNLLQTRIVPEDVAEAVCFLVSTRSAKTTGCILTVDGGLREAFPR